MEAYKNDYKSMRMRRSGKYIRFGINFIKNLKASQ